MVRRGRHIGCLATCGIDITPFLSVGTKFFGSRNNRGDHFTGDFVFISSYCWERRILSTAPTQSKSSRFMTMASWAILSKPKIAGLFPIKVSERRFCSCSVSVHNIAVFRISARKSELLYKTLLGKAFVDVFNGIMDIFFRSRNSSRSYLCRNPCW